MQNMRKKSSKKLVLLLIILVLPTVSLAKYALYEISGVRGAIGKTVVLPEEANAASALLRMKGNSNSGTLVNARYRWNDKLGFFDLEVQVAIEGSQPSISTGLSVCEAFKVKVQDPQQSTAGDSKTRADGAASGTP